MRFAADENFNGRILERLCQRFEDLIVTIGPITLIVCKHRISFSADRATFMITGIQDQFPVALPMESIAAFCQRWKISEFALFGSVLHDDFGPDSDIDVLVTFAPEAEPVPDREKMREELQDMLGRPVDVMYRRVIERDPNYLLRKSILNSAQVIYAA